MFIRLAHDSSLMFSCGSSFFPHVKTEPVRCGHSYLEHSISFSFWEAGRDEGVWPNLNQGNKCLPDFIFLVFWKSSAEEAHLGTAPLFPSRTRVHLSISAIKWLLSFSAISVRTGPEDQPRKSVFYFILPQNSTVCPQKQNSVFGRFYTLKYHFSQQMFMIHI